MPCTRPTRAQKTKIAAFDLLLTHEHREREREEREREREWREQRERVIATHAHTGKRVREREHAISTAQGVFPPLATIRAGFRVRTLGVGSM